MFRVLRCYHLLWSIGTVKLFPLNQLLNCEFRPRVAWECLGERSSHGPCADETVKMLGSGRNSALLHDDLGTGTPTLDKRLNRASVEINSLRERTGGSKGPCGLDMEGWMLRTIDILY